MGQVDSLRLVFQKLQVNHHCEKDENCYLQTRIKFLRHVTECGEIWIDMGKVKS